LLTCATFITLERNYNLGRINTEVTIVQETKKCIEGILEQGKTDIIICYTAILK